MSFRTRLTTTFMLIVVAPILAIGAVVLVLISDSRRGQAEARDEGAGAVAVATYNRAQAQATVDATVLAQKLAPLPASQIPAQAARLQAGAGLLRVGVRVAGRAVYDHGTSQALATGVSRARSPDGPVVKVAVSELAAPVFVQQVSGRGVGVVLHQGGKLLASSFGSDLPAIPTSGQVTIRRVGYQVHTYTVPGYGRKSVMLSVLSSLAATAKSVTGARVVALVLTLSAVALAFAFALLTSRSLQTEIRNVLRAARRLAAGDFSQPIETQGNDEFAELGNEFNSMSNQLDERLKDLGRERERLRQAMQRMGQLFAANLDQRALLDLALQVAVDGVNAEAGRLSSREDPNQPLREAARVGTIGDLGPYVLEAERQALAQSALGEVSREGVQVAAAALRPHESDQRAYGVICVLRRGEPFTEDDRNLLRSLADQATVALENVQLHQQVSRQAVTDLLTGLSNHGHFQKMLSVEVEQVRRYHTPLGLILLDIDNFKSVNDTYGHPQGDRVLKHVAQVMRESSRDADVPARYGGEEMALILPHTDLDGAFAIAERVREAIESMRVPLVDGDGELKVTASLGVSTMTDGEKDHLIADADAALYRAKRGGKNRTERGSGQPANVLSSS